MMKLLTRLRFLPIILIGVLFLSSCEKDKKSGLPTDGDGNEYDTVVIGTQVWLAENLKTTKYNNGVSIPLVTSKTQWVSMSSAAYCWYDNDPTYKEVYGGLYNWWAMKVAFLCPIGYHVPTDEEWNTLINHFGGKEIAGDKLKAIGTQFWESGNHSTNESGFTALPGGKRYNDDGNFAGRKRYGYWWSSSPGIDDESGMKVVMFDSWSSAYLGGYPKKAGYSVRCIKNN